MGLTSWRMWSGSDRAGWSIALSGTAFGSRNPAELAGARTARLSHELRNEIVEELMLI